ncbi:MAG: ATP-dependent DNA helicase [Gammaproteobacteria bacterium]
MRIPVSVKALCHFTAKKGDLDRRFTPAPSAQEGLWGHAQAAARRGAHYETELALSTSEATLTVRGRADGYDAATQRIDEFKTFRGDLARMKGNHRALHWAQLKTYGALLCRRDSLSYVDLALVYFDIDSQEETVLIERFEAEALDCHFAEACAQFSAWVDHEAAHQVERNAALLHLRFPHADFHAGQRLLAEAVYKAVLGKQCVLAQAPTGIGKTVGTLFPMLKAMAQGKLDKIFYLAAKSTGRQTALQATQLLKVSKPDLTLRVLELVAREKACVNPERSCHGESCPLAKGFYDRLAGARTAAVAMGQMDQSALRSVAASHQVCPYYLSQELVRWSDVVIGDYNYFFDTGGLLFGLATENEWRVGLLVDEAHNLIERARAMHTVSLVEADFRVAMSHAPAAIKRALIQLARRWTDLCVSQAADYCVLGQLPAPFLTALQHAVTRLSEFAGDQIELLGEELERLYFGALRFCQLADEFADHSIFDITGTTICIRNVIPAPFLKRRFAIVHAAILFSGTLNPPNFYHDLLGLPDDTIFLDVPSPFMAEQLCVRIVGSISTRWKRRRASLLPIATLVAAQYNALPGNYLVFISSYDYLQDLSTEFSRRHPLIPTWRQHRSMSESDRREFIARFALDGSGIGFAVLGGAFAEGIDLPGDRLIGAFIATLGLPQVNAVNEAIAASLQENFGVGHEYTYLYPGLQKVAQAAGRVIRSTSDQGTLYLIDERYLRPDVRQHLPRWWKPQEWNAAHVQNGAAAAPLRQRDLRLPNANQSERAQPAIPAMLK